jgi:type VI secretion system secreted protein VgrG
MVRYTQAGRFLSVATPLGPDVLLLAGFSGSEAMSQLFSYQLELYAQTDSVAARDIVGKNVTWHVQPSDAEPRYFNGFVSRFSLGGRTPRGLRPCRAEVVPWLWFLTRTANCRIFQNKSTPDILEAVFAGLGLTDYDDSALKRSYPKRDYCVQYRETAFNFVSRLMEEEGIFYFFRHENGKHTLVLADQKGAYEDCRESRARYYGGALPGGQLTAWDHQYEFRPGKWAHTDYNFETPSTNLLASTDTVIDLPGVSKFEVFDYPGRYGVKGDGEAAVKVRMEEEEAAHDVVTAAGRYHTFTPGHKFTLERHEVAAEADKAYVITSIRHAASAAVDTDPERPGEYSNTFTCIPAAVTFRPPRTTPKPVVRGPQTAVVVGPPGQEIHTDKYGRIKVQFFWDREGKRDENSSCWVRVTEAWAGKGWGVVSTPRIGQEVVVDFLEGDPDRPLVTGRVYNAEQMPAYRLPDGKAITGMKSNSTPGGGGFNEICVDDSKGKERITIHAQYDLNTKVEHDQASLVLNNQALTVNADRDVLVKQDLREQVTGTHHVTVNGDRNEKVAGTVSLQAMSTQTKAQTAYAVDAGQEVHVKAGMTLVLEATAVTIKSGSNFVQIDPSGVTIFGTMVLINSGGAAGSGSGCSPTAPDPAKEAQPPPSQS